MQIPFNFKDDSGHIIYRDSLTFESIEEYEALSEEERQTLIHERYDNWLAIVNMPFEEPVLEEEV